MHKLVLLLGLAGAICTGAASPDQARAITDADWDAAATVALKSVEHGDEAIVVLDNKLSPAAQEALKHLRRTTSVEQLPRQDEFELPPGAHYLRVRQFELHGERFEFTITGGVIPRNAGLNCGVTNHFFVLRDAGGTWKPGGSRDQSMC